MLSKDGKLSPAAFAELSNTSTQPTPKASRKPKSKPSLTQKEKLLLMQAALKEHAEKTTFAWQERMFSSPVDADTLAEASKYMQPVHLQEVSTERNLEQLCGYPLCDQSPQDLKGRYRISLREKKVFDVSEHRSYCGRGCLLASRFLATQLSEEPVYARDTESIEIPEILPPGSRATDIQKAFANSKQNADLTELRKEYISEMLSTVNKQGITPIHSVNSVVAPLEGLNIVEKEISADTVKPPLVLEFCADRGNGGVQASDETADTSAHDLVEGFRVSANQSKPDTSSAVLPKKDCETTLSEKSKLLETRKDRPKKGDLETSRSEAAVRSRVFRAGMNVIETATLPSETQIGVPAAKVQMPPNATVTTRSGERENDPIRENIPTRIATPPMSLNSFKKKNKKPSVPQMSLFGCVWTMLDQMITEQTAKFLKSEHGHENGGDCTTDRSDPEGEYTQVLRRNIFSEKILAVTASLRLDLGFTVSVENDLVELIRTFRLNQTTVVLNSLEERVLALVFLISLCPRNPLLESALFPRSTEECRRNMRRESDMLADAIRATTLSMEVTDVLVDMLWGGRWLAR